MRFTRQVTGIALMACLAGCGYEETAPADNSQSQTASSQAVSAPTPDTSADNTTATPSENQARSESSSSETANSNVSSSDNDADRVAYQLASIDAGRVVSDDDASIARFHRLLGQLMQKYNSTERQIGDMSGFAQGKLRDNGINESIQNIMTGMSEINNGGQDYAQVIAMYLTLRMKGWDHEKAVSGLDAMMKGFLRARKASEESD